MAVRLTAATGRTTGSRPSTRLRGHGQVPAVVYGLGGDPVAVSVEWPDLRKVLTSDSGLNSLIDLDVDGEVSLAIVKDLQRHPVRRDVLHVDFLRLDPNADIMVEVPVHLEGEPTAVHKQNGLVDQTLHQLSISVRPVDIPDFVSVDISDLEVGSTITVADIPLPAGARTDVDPEDVVASAYVPRRVAALIAAETAAEEGDESGGEAGGEGGDGGDGAEASADASDDAES